MKRFCFIVFVLFFSGNYLFGQEWKPNTDWGHWILGQKADFNFLKKNNMTVTFGNGAPNFDEVDRTTFDTKMLDAKRFNKIYHDSGYIVLRYLSTSLNGNTKTNKDIPLKDEISYLKFYNERWNDFADYIGPKPEKDPTSWIMIYPDGKFPYYRYAPYGQQPDEGFEAWGVPVNPDYLRVMEGKIRAQAETGIDGSYIDWTHIAEGTSYDEYSRNGFIDYLNKFLPPDISEKKYGTSSYSKITLPEKRGDKFWTEWITYRGWQVADFHKHLRTIARKYNPYFMVSGNVFGGFGYGPIAYLGAGNMEFLAKDGYDDFIYSEMQEYLDAAPRNKDGVRITNSPALKFLTAVSHGKPVIVYATEITPPIFPDPTEKCLSSMSQINIAEAVANHCIFREKRETPPGAADIYNFLASNRENLTGSHLYSNIGILASLKQYLADEQSFAFSCSRVLSDKGINHTFLVEDDLVKAELDNYDLIILPYLPLMSVSNQNALINYVEKGGKLIVLGRTGIKNEYNLPNEIVPFLKLLEVKEYPGSKTLKAVGKGNILFLPLEIPEHKYLTSAGTKNDVTTFGSSMINIFADVPEAYTRGKMHPGLYAALKNVIAESEGLLNGNISKVSSDSGFIEMTTMFNRDKKTLLVHLVNYNVTIDGNIHSAKNIPAEIVLPADYGINKIVYSGNLKDMNELKYEVVKTGNNNKIKVTFPSVSIYGLAVIELK